VPTWLSCILGAVVAALIAILLAPYIPTPGDHIVSIACWFVAVALLICALVAIVRGRGVL
jgi:multisubunit Na+/H+ antiporter MnhE subunit